VIASGEYLIGAGLCLIVGFAVDREGRHDLVCGVEKEAVIASHGASALSREFEEIQRVVHIGNGQIGADNRGARVTAISLSRPFAIALTSRNVFWRRMSANHLPVFVGSCSYR
jgi:hypothetical protein